MTYKQWMHFSDPPDSLIYPLEARVNFVIQNILFCLRQGDLAAARMDFTPSTQFFVFVYLI